MEICGNCDWASGGSLKLVFCEKRMSLVAIAGKCPKWRIKTLPDGFRFRSDYIDISHIDPNEPPVDVTTFEPPKEEPPPLKPKRKRAPNKPKVIPPPPVIPEIVDEDEDIFA